MSHKLKYHKMSQELSCHSYVRTYVPADSLANEFLSCTYHSSSSAESLFSTCNHIMYTYVGICTYVYVCGYMYICICMWVYVHMYMYVGICTYVYVCGYMYICICI